MKSSTTIHYFNLKIKLVFLLILTFFLQSCEKYKNEKEPCNISISQKIDDLIFSLDEGEEITQEDRNRIYTLASDLNKKYKGEMSSDEIIEVVE